MSHHSRLHALLALVVAAVFSSAGSAMGGQADKNPYARANNTWISISGTVESVAPNSFMLDYGDGIIKVEMDDGDRDADGYKLLPDDKVTVYGRIDDDFYEMTKIEAGSVYVETLGTYFFASSADEEDYLFFSSLDVPVIVSSTVVQGTVTHVGESEFVVDTGLRKLTVDVDEMAYDPLDDDGYQKIRVGDRVRVNGKMDNDFFEGRALDARSVIDLSS